MVHEQYLGELDDRLAATLGDTLEGVYLIGSAAYGGYVEGKSDLDVAAVCGERPSAEALDAARVACSHEALPCPARLLELVVYSRDSLARRPPQFELNLNSGREGTRWSTDPAKEPWFWFTIDVALAREEGVALRGPPAAELFPELPPADVRAALSKSPEMGRFSTWPRT